MPYIYILDLEFEPTGRCLFVTSTSYSGAMHLNDINDPDFPSTNSFSGQEVPNVIHNIVCLPGKDRPVMFPPFPSGRVGDPDVSKLRWYGQ